MKKYVVSRKDVCAGVLTRKVADNTTICFDGEVLSLEELRDRGICVEIACGLRGMLFHLDNNGCANDLIYTTPTNYYIDGVSNGTNFSDFAIDNYVRLNELLKYSGYGEDLTQRDLNQIYRKFIASNQWIENNAELFGVQRSTYSYANQGIETLPSEIYYNLLCIRSGVPSREEPGYCYIKKKRI